MAAELPRPGVEVIQEFRTVSPTVTTPTLVPCVVGVCKQIVEVLESTDTGGSQLNPQALITLPGFFEAAAGVGSPARYTGLHGLILAFSVPNGPIVSVSFVDSPAVGLTPATVVSQVNAALALAGVTSVRAETVGSDRWRLRTLAVGEFEIIQIDGTTSPSVLTAFGLGVGKSYAGVSSYQQYGLRIPQTNFPDPRGNLSELAFEMDSVRVFLSLGSGAALRELSRTRSFLRGGMTATAATITGTADLSLLSYGGGGDLNGLTLVLNINGGTNVTVTFGTPASQVAAIAEINAATNSAGYGSLVASTNGDDELVLTSNTTGAESTIQVVSGTALTLLGLLGSPSDVGEAVVDTLDDGNGDNLTPIVRCIGQDFTASATAASIEGTADITSVGLYGGGGTLVGTSLSLSDGTQVQTITFGTLADASALLVALNGLFGSAAGGKITATQGGTGGNKLILTSSALGVESFIRVVGGDAAALLGLTAGTTRRGNPFRPLPGDELYVDGTLVGTINQVAPGGFVDRLRINRQLAISNELGDSFYIVATGVAAAATSTRPSAELSVDLNGTVRIKHEVLRDVFGSALSSTAASIYLQYRAVRKDVTASASDPGLLRFDSLASMEQAIGPVSVDNPLALALFLTMAAAPNTQIAALGVDEVSADAPYGTSDAFVRAAEYLEAFEVYAIPLLTDDPSVAAVFRAHVVTMSEPANKGERITLFAPAQPTSKLDSLVASGARGNTVGSGGVTFDTSITNLTALLVAADISPLGTIPVSEGLYLDIADNSLRYSIESINGSQVTLRTTFQPGENDDDFYATTDLNTPPLTGVLVDTDFSIRVRGASLVGLDGRLDRQALADTYTAMASGYSHRRFWHVPLPSMTVSINGLTQSVPGFYACAILSGMIGQLTPSQSFTNLPLPGVLSITGTNNLFTERQLNQMAAGGNFILVQDVPGGAVTVRQALTTDMTSVETRTDSITKALDYTAKFMRLGLKNFIGKFNISQGFIDSLGHVNQGLLSVLVENKILDGASPGAIVQDEDEPDSVLVEVEVDPAYPCNKIKLTLVV